jgi:hypothetical protein
MCQTEEDTDDNLIVISMEEFFGLQDDLARLRRENERLWTQAKMLAMRLNEAWAACRWFSRRCG